MTEVPGGMAIDGVYVYPASDPLTYYVLPLTAGPEVDSSGRPTLLLVPTGDTALLQLGAQLPLDDSALERVRQQLAEQLHGQDQSVVRLSPAPLRVDAARLMISSGDQAWTELARSTTSGFPPYMAVFGVPLKPDQSASALAAVQGRQGFLQVVYDVSVAVPCSITGELAGSLVNILRCLDPTQPDEDLDTRSRVLLEGAIADGDLRLDLQGADGLPSEATSVREDLITRGQCLIMQIIRGQAMPADLADVRVTTELNQSMDIPVPRVTDVATWFPAGEGSSHILIPAGQQQP
jgi:hypothetical protein